MTINQANIDLGFYIFTIIGGLLAFLGGLVVYFNQSSRNQRKSSYGRA